jgi:hypothetical protein
MDQFTGENILVRRAVLHAADCCHMRVCHAWLRLSRCRSSTRQKT